MNVHMNDRHLARPASMTSETRLAPPTSSSAMAWLRTARGQRFLEAVLLGLVMLLIMMYRRPTQFEAPYVWVEDGLLNITDYLASGWKSLWHPIAGYFSVPIKLLNALSMSLSFRWLPEISMALALLFTYAVLLAVAYAPTRLRWPFACALAVMLIPSDSENFAVSLYVGWWGSILALLPLYWNGDARRDGLRIALIVIGGLSSPLIAGLVPLYAIRYALIRKRIELVALLVVVVISALQYYAVSQAKMVPGGKMFGISISMLIEKFFGLYLSVAPNFLQSGLLFWLGLGLIAFIVASWLQHRRELGLTFILLGLSLGVAIASTVARVPLDIIHPVQAGPRYFFFPFILLSWVLIQLASLDKAGTRLFACMILAASLRNMLDGGRRLHGTQDWRGSLQACLQTPLPQLYKIPIHYTGDNNNLWHLELNADQCRKLIQESLFDNKVAP
jgi:hypothetical protein